MKHIFIFTDGACRGNPGPGGWGAILRYGSHEKEIYGSEPHTTNNRMELMAAIEALKCLKGPSRVEVTTDSQYVQKGITQWITGWRKNHWKNSQKKPVANADLWQQLDALAKEHEMHWHWVRGHQGHAENERADQLANLAIDEFLGITG